jgi:hypothetical protein
LIDENYGGASLARARPLFNFRGPGAKRARNKGVAKLKKCNVRRKVRIAFQEMD